MRGFTIMVATIVSTVLHFFILTLFDTIPLISKEIPQRNLYMVDLVTLPVEQPAPQKKEAAVPKQTVEVKKEEVKKEEVKKEAKKEEPKKETVKEEVKKNTVVLEAPSKKKATQDKAKEESTEEPTVNDDQQRLAAIKEIEQKVADRTTDDALTGSQDYDYNKLENQVKSFWAIPDTLSEEGLKAIIVIEISKNGEVVRTKFEQSSGNLVFDQAAIRAIMKAAPFDPPTGSIPLKIGLRFP